MTLRANKKDSDVDLPDISHRAVGPNLGQLHLLRCTVFGMLSDHFYKAIVEKKRWAKITKDINALDAVK